MYNVITERLKLVDAYPEIVSDIASRFKLEDPEFIRKGLTVDDLKLEEGERAVISHITTGAKDRDDEIVDPKGAILTDFKKNPVVLWGHDHRSLPIGRAVWVKSDEKGLVAKVAYASAEVNPFAEQIFKAHQEKIPIAKSIGFIPVVVEEPKEGSPEFKQGVRRIFKKWIMLEFSDVPVPSNPEAINIAVSKGLISEDEKEGYGITIIDDEAIQDNGDVVITNADLIKEFKAVDEERNKDQTNYVHIETPHFCLTPEQTEALSAMSNEQVHQIVELIKYYKEEKRADLKGNPSVSDIFRAINKLINPIEGRWDNWVVDLFPKKYPSGHVIIENSTGETITFKQFDYTFDDGVVTLSDKFIELEEGYKPKSFMSIEEKAGRVLSGKNRTTITNAVRAMGAATVSLNQLLSDTEKPPKPDEEGGGDEDDDKKDFITLADEPEPDIEKMVNERAQQLLKEKITESITDVFKRQRGKV